MRDERAEQKHRHELRRREVHDCKIAIERAKNKRGGGKSPRKAIWHSSAAAGWKPVKRSAWKRPGVPRNK